MWTTSLSGLRRGTLGKVAFALRADLESVKRALRADKKRLNDAKEQVCGPIAGAPVWTPPVTGELSALAGASHPHCHLGSQADGGPPTRGVGGGRERRGAMTVAVFCGKALLGREAQ